MIPKIFLPIGYTMNRKVENIMAWLESEMKIAETIDKIKLSEISEDKPLTFIIGHLHYEGISNLIERVNETVRERYGGKVKLIITDSWEYGEGYAGDHVVITDSGAVESGDVRVVKEIWATTKDWQEKNFKYFCPAIEGMIARKDQGSLQ